MPLIGSIRTPWNLKDKDGCVMAFRILSPEELELLTETQRKAYDEELAVHLERVKFVEQMEIFENTVVKPYKPKLKRLAPVKKAPEMEYSRPEYTVEVEVAHPCPVPNLGEVAIVRPQDVSLPVYREMSIPERDYQKPSELHTPSLPELCKAVAPTKVLGERPSHEPELPKVDVAHAPNFAMNAVAPVQVDLPEYKGSAIPMTKPFAPITVDEENIRKAAAPIVSQAPECVYRASEISMVSLPEVQRKVPTVKDYVSPELRHSELPEVHTLSQMHVSFIQPRTHVDELPDTVKPVVRVPSFHQPEIEVSTEFDFASVVAPIKEFGEIRAEMRTLPRHAAPQLPQKKYEAPQGVQAMDLTELTKPLAIPEVDAVQLSASVREIEYPTLDIVPEISSIKVPCVAPEVTIPEGPVIPDIQTDGMIQTLLQAMRK